MANTQRYSSCQYCGKRGYPNRSEAKKAAKQRHPSERVSAYRCTLTPEGIEPQWHIGHLPPYVKKGVDRALINHKKRDRP